MDNNVLVKCSFTREKNYKSIFISVHITAALVSDFPWSVE